MRQKRAWALLVAVLILGAACVLPTGAANGTNPTPPGWVGKFDEWAGQKDMSAYNPVVTPVAVRTMDEETAKAYPGVTIIRPDSRFFPGNDIGNLLSGPAGGICLPLRDPCSGHPGANPFPGRPGLAILSFSKPEQIAPFCNRSPV